MTCDMRPLCDGKGRTRVQMVGFAYEFWLLCDDCLPKHMDRIIAVVEGDKLIPI